MHQREWALSQAITTITWTCDPLVRRNVGFNLNGLGATVEHYLVDHYGPMDDGLNRGDQTDRIEFDGDLLGSRASQDRQPFIDAADLPLAVTADAVTHAVDGAARRVQLPADIESLRSCDPVLATAWRHAVRDAVLEGLDQGARVLGLTENGELVLR